MKIALYIVAILIILFGIIWFFQGINIIPGSFMTGQIQWAVYGAVAVVAGAGLLVFAVTRKRKS
jgi:hypothetical protein